MIVSGEDRLGVTGRSCGTGHMTHQGGGKEAGGGVRVTVKLGDPAGVDIINVIITTIIPLRRLGGHHMIIGRQGIEKACHTLTRAPDLGRD